MFICISVLHTLTNISYHCLFIACAGEADLTFILDTSGSVGIRNFVSMKNFVMKIIDEMNVRYNGVRVALITYSRNATLNINLNQFTSKTLMKKAISKLSYPEGAGTNTAAALAIARNVYQNDGANRLAVQDYVIIITDGKSSNPKSTVWESARLHDYGVQVFAIGIGKYVSERAYLKQEMNDIASDPDGDYSFHLEDFNELKSIEDALVRRTCRGAPVSK